MSTKSLGQLEWTANKLFWVILPIIAAIAFLAVLWPLAVLLSVVIFLIIVMGTLVIFKHSDLGIIASLLVVSFLMPALSYFIGVSGDSRLYRIAVLGLLGLTGFSVLLEHLSTKRRLSIVCRPLLFLLLGIFLVINVLALGYGLVRYEPLEALLDADWMLWAGFFVLITLKPSIRLIQHLAVILVVTSLLQSLLGIVRLIEGQGTMYLSTGGDRYVSGPASLWIASGLIACLIMLIYVVRNWSQRFLLIAISVLLSTGIILSFNRQTWLALGVSLLCGFLLFFKGRRRRLISIAVVSGSILYLSVVAIDSSQVFPVQIQDAVTRRLAGGSLQELRLDPSYQFRLSAWLTALRGIFHNPILGMGWGSPFAFSIVVPRTGIVQTFDSSPHNTYLWLGYKAGVFSILSFLGFTAVQLFNGFKQLYRYTRNRSPLAVYLMASVLIQIVYLSGAFFWDYLSVMYLSVPIWLNSGVLAALTSNTASQEPLPKLSRCSS